MTIAGVVRVALASLLLVSAAAKALDPSGMAAIIDSYGFLPAVLALPAAVTMTSSEAAIGCLLLTARWRIVGCVASAAVHAVYFAWSAAALMRGLAIANCGCFGTLWPRPLSSATLVEDGVLVLVSLVLTRHYCRRRVALA